MMIVAQSTVDLGRFWIGIQSNVYQSLVVIVIGLVVWFLARLSGRRWQASVARRLGGSEEAHDRERAQRLATLWAVAQTTINVTLVAIAVVTLMGVWGIPTGPFVAAASVIGIALGFGAQDFVRDVIAGVLILLEDQYAIGDVVQIAGVTGTVHDIRLRTTLLRDLDGLLHHVPNGEIRVASNFTAGFSKVVVDLSVAYREDIDRVIEVIRDEVERFEADPDLAAGFTAPSEVLGVNQLGDSAVDVRVVFTVTTEVRWVVKREFLRRMKNRFDAEGIEIPFPYLTVVNPQE